MLIPREMQETTGRVGGSVGARRTDATPINEKSLHKTFLGWGGGGYIGTGGTDAAEKVEHRVVDRAAVVHLCPVPRVSALDGLGY